MTAGRRDTLVTLQRYSATSDAAGEEVQSWVDLGLEWAAVFYGRGDERRRSAMEQGQQAATFQVLSNERTRSVSVRDRIALNGDNWDIISTASMDRATIDLTAVRSLK